MAATFEPTLNLNASMLRAPYSTSAAPSMADTLPALNFGFDDLRACMNDFTKRFDDFIEKGRKRVLDERNHFRMQVASVKEDQHKAEGDISRLSAKSATHADAVASQSAETAEMQEAIAGLSAQRDAHAANVAALRGRVAGAKGAVASKRAAQRQHQQYMAHQASFNGPEIEAWERALGMRIEGAGRDDVVKFVFVGLDRRDSEGGGGGDEEEEEKEGEGGGAQQRRRGDILRGGGGREAWFELDMRGEKGRGYEVRECRPRLDARAVERAVREMCEREELGLFLRDMRALYARAMR